MCVGGTVLRAPLSLIESREGQSFFTQMQGTNASEQCLLTSLSTNSVPNSTSERGGPFVTWNDFSIILSSYMFHSALELWFAGHINFENLFQQDPDQENMRSRILLAAFRTRTTRVLHTMTLQLSVRQYAYVIQHFFWHPYCSTFHACQGSFGKIEI